LLACCEGGGAFGAKNFAQAIITIIDNNDATRIRSSGRRPVLFCGSLTNVSRPCSLRARKFPSPQKLLLTADRSLA
jgi:hypothetical protein